MRELYFDVWAGDDLIGTSIGELTDASAKTVTMVDNGMGSGSFVISRHSSQYAWVTPGPTTPEPLIRWRRVAGGPFDYDDARYKGAFFVEEGNDILVSQDEEGGEDATRSGRGIESMLSRAVIDYVAHYSDDIVNHPYDKTALTDGQWHISENIPHAFVNAGTPGAVLRIFLRNAGAQVPEPIVEVNHSFNINNDSNGDPWPDGDAEWSFDVGTDLLTVLGILVNGGLYYRMTPDFMLDAWPTPRGTDLSASISLVQADKTGKGIATSSEQAIHASPAKSRMLVKGQTTTGGRKYRWVADTGIESVLGVRQGSLDYQATPTNAILDKAGSKELTALKTQHDGPPTLGVDEMAGQEAFIDYFPGDTVTVDIPGVFDTDAVRIFSITLQETETGEADPILEFSGEAWSGVNAPASATERVWGDPFFINDPSGFLGADGEVMLFRDAYDIIGAGDNTTDDFAFMLMRNDAILFNLQNDVTGSGYAAIEMFDSGIFMEGAQYVFDIGDTFDDSKFYFAQGWGIVVPWLASDPTSGQSEQGQVYYNTTSDKLRWHNGTIWQDVGAGSSAFVPTSVYVECNTPTTVSNGTFDFDTFYDVEQNDLSGVLPASLGLSYAAGVFTADEAGVWLVHINVVLAANPGQSGIIKLNTTNYSSDPRVAVAAVQPSSDWYQSWHVTIPTSFIGSGFSLSQQLTGAVAGAAYATIDITRISDGVS
jgi:hypothetical protein